MMTRQRKALGGIAALAALGLLVACGTTTDPGSAESTAPEGDTSTDEGTTYQIATVPKVEGISWFEAMADGVAQFDSDFSDEVEAWQIGPDTEDAAKQIQIIEDLIAQEVDAIVVVPNDPQAVAPTLEKARERGIVVVTHEAPALAGTEAVDYDLESFDNAEFGQAMGEKLAECMGGEGTYLGMVGSLTSETHMAWYNAAKDYLTENYPDITLLTENPYEDNNDDAAARANALEILRAYPDLGGYVNGSVSANANMAAVLKEKNITSVCMSGLSLPSVAGPYLEEGWMYSAQTWNPAGAGYAANAVALAILKGETIESGMDLGWEGYESITVDGGLVVANAIMMLEKGQFPDGEYPF
jgi:simple sugar transport system substrate-binding protein